MPFCIGGAQYNNFLHELIWVNSHAYLSRHDIDIQMYSLMYLFCDYFMNITWESTPGWLFDKRYTHKSFRSAE